MNSGPLFELLILSCDGFSDLWEINDHYLSKNWPEAFPTASIVSETKVPDFQPHFRVIQAGKVAYAEKVKTALAQIKAPYVIVLLDDYLLTRAIDNSVINEIVLEAISHKADYVRFDKFRGERKVKDAKYLNSIKSLGNRPYQVNMEPSLWKTPTLIELLDGQQTAWALEVSLTENAKKHNLRCFSASGKYLPYLDTIRKGKILHKAYKTLQKSPYYKGKREKCPLKCEARLFFISIAKAVTPFSLQKAIKRQLVRRGHRYYSNWEQN